MVYVTVPSAAGALTPLRVAVSLTDVPENTRSGLPDHQSIRPPPKVPGADSVVDRRVGFGAIEPVTVRVNAWVAFGLTPFAAWIVKV
jgi:hypothetical protein